MSTPQVTSRMRRLAPVLRWVGAALILVFVIRQTGGAPFREGLRAVDVWVIVVGVLVTAATTLCVAARWREVTRVLGGGLDLRTAVGAYYRSQFLNVVLPTGVLGDAHRAAGRRRHVGWGRSIRAVVWDRVCGQAIQLVLTGVALLFLPSPLRGVMPVILAVAVVGGVALGVMLWAARGSTIGRVRGAVWQDARRLLARRVRARIGAESVAALVGHLVCFLVAMGAVGVPAGLGTQVGLALVVLAAMAIPLSLAGWGPREGVAFWAFGAMGLGGSTGVSVTTVYAVLVLCSLAPGALLLTRDVVRRRRRADDERVDSPSMDSGSPARLEADRG